LPLRILRAAFAAAVHASSLDRHACCCREE
jgi:hypothetical protein